MIGREKQLIKKLNKQNSNYTMDYMLSLINEEEVLKQKSGIIWSFYKKQRKDSYGIIKKHFLQILDSIEDFQKIDFIEYILKNEKYKTIVFENICGIIKSMSSDRTKIHMLQKLYKVLLNEDRKFVENNIEKIIESTQAPGFLEAIDSFRGVSRKIDKKINEAMDNRKKDIAISMLCRETNKGRQFLNGEDAELIERGIKRYTEILETMLEEIMKDQKCSPHNIDCIARGKANDVYRIGDKVIKLGIPKAPYKIPNYKRILQPLIRNDFKCVNGDPFARVEITEYANVNISNEEKKRIILKKICEKRGTPNLKFNIKDIDENDILYLLYKEFRSRGIILTEFTWDNFGILKRKNMPVLNTVEMDVAPGSVGFEQKVETTLKEGEIVYVDLDHIYSDTMKEAVEQMDKTSRKMEQRFRKSSTYSHIATSKKEIDEIER